MIEIMLAAEESNNGGASATYQEALSGPEGKEWKKAFDAEVKSLNDNKCRNNELRIRYTHAGYL